MPYSNSNSRGSSGRGYAPQDARTSREYQSSRAHLSEPRRRESRTPYRSNRNYRTISGHDAGLNVRNGMGRRRRQSGILGRFGISNRELAFMVGGVVILILLIFGISSCVRGCSSKSASGSSQATTSKKAVNSVDKRVAAGTSEALTKKLKTSLDQADGLDWIAAHANKYSDSRLVELAMREPTAISFVKGALSAKSTAKSYTDGTEKGSYPLLYDWDTRWGYVSYAGSIMGVTGSGPTTLSMAYMGLTGKNDQTPSVLAKLATSGKYTDKTTGTAAKFFTEVGAKIGLTVNQYTASASNIQLVLGNGGVVAVQLKAGFTTPYAHWALAMSSNSDGSVSMYDPDSTSASTHTWAAGTIAANASDMYALTSTNS